MRIILLLPILFLSFLSPVNSEIKEKKEYGEYSFYSKCLDEALPRTMNNGLVYECSMKAKEKIDTLIQEKISTIDFNYKKYGRNRFKMFLYYKNIFENENYYI